GVDARSRKALQTTSLAVDASDPYLGADADLVCASLDDRSDVGRSAGASGDGNATPVECTGDWPCHTGAVEPLLDHYIDRVSADRKRCHRCAQHSVVWQNASDIFRCDCLGAAALVGASPFFHVPTADRSG